MQLETVAQQTARLLLESGVDTVFGLPGGENLVLLEALRRAGVRFFLTRHESSALFMAAVTARLTGRVSACLTTLGPGAANSVAGVAHAFLDRCPVLLFTAQLSEDQLATATHQALDLARLFSPITKGTFQLQASRDGQTLARAYSLATAGRPGPVLVQVAADVAASPTTHWATLVSPGAEPEFVPEQMATARQLLAQAQRSVIVAGLGLEPERPYRALARLAQAWAVPVVTTPIAKGALPEDHPLAAGVIGLTASDPAYRIIDEADCILALGFDVVELVKPWRQEARLIWLAPWPNDQPRLPASAELVGSIEAGLRQLAEVQPNHKPGWAERQLSGLRRVRDQRSLPQGSDGRLSPQSVIDAVRSSSPRETIAVTDVGAHKILAGLRWPSYLPNSYLVSNGLSSMGFGLPAAVAASRLYPHRPVVCFTGDGGLAMALGELSLAAALSTPLIVVAFNDGALELIRAKQLRSGFEVYGTTFTNPDFSDIARAFGIRYFRAEDGDGCAAATREAIDHGRPVIVEALIDPAAYPLGTG